MRKVLFATLLFFTFAFCQTKDGAWVLSSKSKYNTLSDAAKSEIDSQLNPLVQAYNDEMKNKLKTSTFKTYYNCRSVTDNDTWGKAAEGASSSDALNIKSFFTKTVCDEVDNPGLVIDRRTLSTKKITWDEFIEYIGGYANLAQYNNTSVFRSGYKSGYYETGNIFKFPIEKESRTRTTAGRTIRTWFGHNYMKPYFDTLYSEEELDLDFAIVWKLGQQITIKENNQFEMNLEMVTPDGSKNRDQALKAHNLEEMYYDDSVRGVITLTGEYTFPNITTFDMINMVKYWEEQAYKRSQNRRDFTKYKGPQVIFNFGDDYGSFSVPLFTVIPRRTTSRDPLTYPEEAKKYTPMMVSLTNKVIEKTPNAFIVPQKPASSTPQKPASSTPQKPASSTTSIDEAIAEREEKKKQLAAARIASNTPQKTASANLVVTSLSYRNQLVQFVNAYFGEQNNQNISDEDLHEKLKTFFNQNSRKDDNASGWENFRKNKDRKAAGISDDRYSEIRKDLKKRNYYDIVENHLYRTAKGQKIWMELGFPYDNNRMYLVDFVNTYFGEQNNQNISDEDLHEKLLTFFNKNRNKGSNASGWENFRKNKDRKAAGISDDRYSEITKDLKKRDYEDIIGDHLYRTQKGQEIWMELGLPYVKWR